jgi:hypothetical protein
MKNNKYSVYFVGAGEEVVEATGASHAVILACAERIKKGLHIKAFSIKDWDDGRTYPVNPHTSITVNWTE